MANLKPVVEKLNKDNGKAYYIGNLRIATYRSNILTKAPKFWIHVFFPSPITLKEPWENKSLSAETREEAEEKIKEIVNLIVIELSE